MIKVSIVVPVYNVYDYIEKCLTSLAKQSIDDYEVIVVNDGSPDKSQDVIDQFVIKYPTIFKSFVKKNGGLSDARNYGIKKASGEYIGFIDGDDYADENMFKILYEKAKENNFDVVVCDVNYVFPDKIKTISSNVLNDSIDNLKGNMLNIYPAAWNKIYKRSLFETGVSFKRNVWYEDVEFLYRIFPYIKSIGTVNIPLINYVQRENSIIKTFDKRLYNYIDNFNGIVDFYKEKGFYNEYYKELEYVYVRYLYSTFIINATNFDKEEYNNAVKIAKANVKSNFPHYRRNMYFYHSLKGIYMLTFCFFSYNLIYYFTGVIKKIFLKH